MIYLLDTSGLVRLLKDPGLQNAWYEAIDAEAIGSCYPQRAEFLYSARNASEYEEIMEMFNDLYPDVSVPKTPDAGSPRCSARWPGQASTEAPQRWTSSSPRQQRTTALLSSTMMLITAMWRGMHPT